MSSSQQPPILIIGAGISGLALAQGLLKSSIPFRIFERDPVLNVRSQGYRVRISDNGIAALESLLDNTLFSRLEASCASVATGSRTQNAANAGAGPRWRLNARSMEKIESNFGPPPNLLTRMPLNADRSVLRSVLIHGLEEYVEFGKTFESYRIDSAGSSVVVRFSDGSEVTGRLLVGADGASSRVKKQLIPHEKLLDTEGRLIYGKTTLTPSFLSKFSEAAQNGLVVVVDQPSSSPSSTSPPSPPPPPPPQGQPTTLLLEVIRFKDNEFRGDLPADYVYWVLMSRKNSPALRAFEPDDAALLKLDNPGAAKLANQLTEEWHSSIRVLFEDQDVAQTSLIRVQSARPEIARWDSCQGCVTLIGDAAHVMSPSAGVGAVTALRDAAVLMEALKDGKADISGQAAAVERYAEEMRRYAGEAIISSSRGGKMLFGMPPFEEMDVVA